MIKSPAFRIVLRILCSLPCIVRILRVYRVCMPQSEAPNVDELSMAKLAAKRLVKLSTAHLHATTQHSARPPVTLVLARRLGGSRQCTTSNPHCI